jgi:hypothetical protein
LNAPGGKVRWCIICRWLPVPKPPRKSNLVEGDLPSRSPCCKTNPAMAQRGCSVGFLKVQGGGAGKETGESSKKRRKELEVRPKGEPRLNYSWVVTSLDWAYRQQASVWLLPSITLASPAVFVRLSVNLTATWLQSIDFRQAHSLAGTCTNLHSRPS